MNITINRAELLNAARRMAAVAPSSSPLEILRGVLLETDAGTGKLTLTATNLEVSLEEKLPCSAADDDALVVGAQLLTWPCCSVWLWIVNLKNCFTLKRNKDAVCL